jgi:glycosyltransferase involved in cell wall biosynthesis
MQLAETYRLAKQAYLVIKRDRPIARRVTRLLQQNDIDLVHHNNSLAGNRATILAARTAGIGQAVNTFIYMSRAIESFYTDLGIPASKGRVIYDGFDSKVFGTTPTQQTPHRANSVMHAALRAELGVGEHDRLISNVGRLDWWKGQDYFLQAISQLIRSFPGDQRDSGPIPMLRRTTGSAPAQTAHDGSYPRRNIKALLIGAPDASASSQAFAQKLHRMVDELQLSKHVVFTGFRSDVPQLMAASDIVVHSSSKPEPFGRVIVEAMLMGRPIIATGAGGPLEILQDQVTGLLVPTKDATAMAQALDRLLRNREQAEAMGQRARSQALQRFSVRQHIQEITGLYQEILSTS